MPASHSSPQTHLCWGYEDHTELTTAVATFLGDGVGRHERVVYVGSGPIGVLARDLDGLADIGDLLGSGAAEMWSLQDVYDESGDQVQAYRDATAAALRDGYAGLRVAADVTVLVEEPDRRDAFVRYEHRMDRAMADGLAFRAMCAFDKRLLGVDAFDEVACVHPSVHGSGSPFRLHAGVHGLTLSGEVDGTSASAFALALERVIPSAGGPTVDLDCAGLEFLNHRALVALDAAAARIDATVQLVNPPLSARLILDLMPMQRLRTDASS